MTTNVSQTSKKISELAIGKPEDEDYIILERGNISKKILYSDFKNALANSITIGNCGDMIHQNKDDFSKFAHGHTYSNFDFFPSYGPDSKNTRQYIKLGEFKMRLYGPGNVVFPVITKQVCTLSASDTVINELEGYEPNQVGDIKFFAIKNFRSYIVNYLGYSVGSVNGIQNILIDSKFGGWVVPNGATYTCGTSQFREACAAFGTGAGATSFTVPNLCHFIKSKSTAEALTYTTFHNALQSHTHGLDTDCSAGDKTITVNGLQFIQGSQTNKNDTSNRETLHGGKESSGTEKVEVTVTNVSITGASITNATVQTATGDSIESYPNHYELPCLIYIGKE